MVSAKHKNSRKGGSKFPFFVVRRELKPFLRSSDGRLGLAFAVSIALTALEVITVILIGLGLDSVLDPLHRHGPVLPLHLEWSSLLAVLAGAALLRGLLVTRQQALAASIGERAAARMRAALWEHLQQLPMDYIRTRGPGRLLPRFHGDAAAVERLVTHGLLQMSQAWVAGAGLLLGLALLNHHMALGAAVMLPLLGLVFWSLSLPLREESRAARRRGNRLSAYLQERILGMGVVQAFTQQAAEAETFSELNRDVARRGTRRALLAGRFHGWSATGVALAGVIALALSAHEAGAGRITPGTLAAFYAVLGLLLPVLLRIASANSCFQEDQIPMERLLGFLELEPQKTAPKKSADLKITNGEILFENVSCQLDKKTTLLAGTSLRARRGALTAVVGPNGCGKTTLLELLLHFRSLSTGRILIDGQDIAEVSLKSLRAQVGLITEDLPLFEGTIRENIAYGLPVGGPPDAVQRAAQLAGADRFIEKLPKGWNTRIGRGASRLSRSQRQQLVLARALAVNPAILLFDEPAAALDAETENAFVQILHSLSRHKTVIVAARRLPPSLRADQSFTLDPIPEGKRRKKKPGRNGEAAQAADSDNAVGEDGE